MRSSSEPVRILQNHRVRYDLDPPSKLYRWNTAFQQSMDPRCVDCYEEFLDFPPTLFIPPFLSHQLGKLGIFQFPTWTVLFFFAKFVDFHNGFLRFFPQKKTPKKNRTWKAWQRYIIICCALDWEVLENFGSPTLFYLHPRNQTYRLIPQIAILERRYIFQLIIHSIHWLILGCILVGNHGMYFLGSKVWVRPQRTGTNHTTTKEPQQTEPCCKLHTQTNVILVFLLCVCVFLWDDLWSLGQLWGITPVILQSHLHCQFFLRCSNGFEIDNLPETNSSDLKMDGWMMVEILYVPFGSFWGKFDPFSWANC